MLAFCTAVEAQTVHPSGLFPVSPKIPSAGKVDAKAEFVRADSRYSRAACGHSESVCDAQPRRWALILVVPFAVLLLIGSCSVIGGALLMPAISDFSSTARKTQVVQQMEKIGNALNAYRLVHGYYPASYAKVQGGQAGCSWRLIIASHLAGVDASRLPDASESWDSSDNLNLALNIPRVFVSPLVPAPPTATETHVFAVMHPLSAILHPDCEQERTRWGDAAGSHSQKKILAVYLPNHTAHWAAPVDMTPKRLQDEVSTITPDNPVVFLFSDGSIISLEKSMKPFVLNDILSGRDQ